jgi:hypothetical protein
MAIGVSVTGVFSRVGYHPHQTQRRIHAQMERTRFRVVCAGRRTGKSTLGGHELTTRAWQAFYTRDKLDPYDDRAEYWIVGPEYSDAEKEFRVLYSDLTKMGFTFDKPGTYYDANGGNMHISLFGGRFLVHAKSAKYPDTLVGEKLRGVILAEAAKLKPSVWTKYLRPTLADSRGWALLTSTPEGRNWFYDAWQLGQRTDLPNWWSIRMPSWVNNFVFPGGRQDTEILDMEHDMSEERFNQEIGADFSEYVGQVFKDFDEEIHVMDLEYNPRLPVYIATDYGFTNPNVALFIQVDSFDNVFVIAEYYHHRRTPEEFASEVAEDDVLGPLARAARELYPDPEDPGASKTLSQKWLVGVKGGTGGLIKDRIDLIRKWLKIRNLHLERAHKDRAPKLLIDRKCKNMIREMQDYRYPEDKLNGTNPIENPLKKDDHCPEALGRFFAGFFGPKEPKAQSRVRTATVRTPSGLYVPRRSVAARR